MDERIDLVCGMNLRGTEAPPRFSHAGKERYFCSDYCRERYAHNPKKFEGTPLIELRNVAKVYDLGKVKVEALRGLSLRIWEGDFTAIIGASGSGKSTALHIAGLLDGATSGNVFLEGRDVAGLTDAEKSSVRSRVFGFVFQQYHLLPWLTAFDNVRLPLVFAGRDGGEDRVRGILKDVGLAAREGHRPYELSGGEQQRVSLARALVNDPRVILADEPTGNLDSATGNKILEMLHSLKKEHGKTLVVVTHDRDIAADADQILVIKDGALAGNHHAQFHKLTE